MLFSEEKEGRIRAADSRRLIISCPKGTDPEAFKNAVREFAEETLKLIDDFIVDVKNLKKVISNAQC